MDTPFDQATALLGTYYRDVPRCAGQLTGYFHRELEITHLSLSGELLQPHTEHPRNRKPGDY